jgi:Tfp pilus assembly protein PilF
VVRYRRTLALQPRSAAAHGNLGAALAAKGRLADALTHYQQALRADPGHAGVHFNLGIALTALGRIEEAVSHYRQAVVLKPDYADAHNNLANCLAAHGHPDEAISHYERAIASNSDHAEAHNNLGNLLLETGSFEAARSHYDRAIEIDPTRTGAHYRRAEIKTFRPGDKDLAALEKVAATIDLPVDKAPFIHFALAKAREDCGDYAGAFAQLRRGNDLKRRQIPYDEAADIKLSHDAATIFDGRRMNLSGRRGDPSMLPVFVLGMPRSGSTMIEQILARHPQIHGAGELTALDAAIRKVLGSEYPQCVPGLGSDTLRRLGQEYLCRLPLVAQGEIRLVDKLPGNFLHIGLIRLILPNARIIHTTRDPVETCMSCYSRLFASGQYYSYDMGELGRYYRRYSDLMEHWRPALPPGAMIEVAYEDVVDNLEREARRLIEYCGLAWDDRCLNFHEGSGPVKTASAVQVRKPLFRSSVRRWRRYESEIGPLLRELDGLTAEDFHHVRTANAG